LFFSRINFGDVTKFMPKNPLSAWQKIALAFLGLLLSLVLLEAGLRFGGFVLSSIQEYRNLQSIKQKGAYRILCIGESTTQGQYPHLLEQVLNQRNIGVRFSVIDKGRGGKRSSTLLEEIEPNLAEYHPDMVVAMMGINDAGVRYYQDIPDSESWLFRHCRIYRFGRILYMHILKKLKREDIFGINEANSGKGDKQSPGRAQAPFPQSGPKEAFAPSFSTEDLVKKAIELDPDNDKAYVLPQVEDLLKKAIELDPNNDKAYFELGKIYQEQPTKFPQAGALFEKAFELNPSSDNGAMLGRYYHLRGEFQKAEDLFKKIIQSDPTSARAYFELGWLYRFQGKWPQAEAALKKSIDLNPAGSDARVLGALLMISEEMGKPELAREYAEMAYRKRMMPSQYGSIAVDNYHKLKEILDKKRVRLVCAQYPMRDVKSLEEIFKKDEGVIFVDNESVFKEAVRKDGYKEYFEDLFAGDFGHCTQKGNMLLAQNIADVILREIFDRS
jgi:tetratricopeptide (TPR) repeat protein